MGDVQTEVQRPAADPRSISVADLARLLSAVGGQPVTPDMIEADIASGAPTNADGTINLVHYCAWLVREMSAHGG